MMSRLKPTKVFSDNTGMSSGANVCAAIQMARTMKKGSKIVTVIVDRRDRYFAEYPNEHYVV